MVILGLIGLIALAIRLLYIRQIETIPFFYTPISDAKGYNDWARTIAAGNWWGDQTFYQAPLYPYVLALIKLLLGDSLLAARVVQAVLGSLSCGLVGLAGWGFISRRAGLWSAGILACYPPAIFFDGLIQKTCLGQFLAAGLLATLAWTVARPGRAKALLSGLILGLYALTRENALALVPVVGIWLWLGFGQAARVRRLGWCVLLLAGLAAVLVPVGLRNLIAGGQFALTTFQMGPNFYIGNSPQATGRYVPLVAGHETPDFERRDATELAERARGHALSPREVSAYWMGQAWQFTRSEPLAWLKLLATKWLLVWNAYEIPDSESYYIYAAWSWLLGTLAGLLHFGVLLPLAAAGVVLTWPQRRQLWVLYALALTMAAAVAVFYVFARYRYALVPVLVLFAGAALAGGLPLLRQRRYRGLRTAAAVAVVAAVVCNLRINPEAELNATAWGNLGGALAQQGRINQAVIFFEKAVKGAPNAPEMRYNLGTAYSLQGRLLEAVAQLRAALEIEPDLPEAEFQLASALERLGQYDEALLHYGRALARNPSDADAQAAIKRLTKSAS